MWTLDNQTFLVVGRNSGQKLWLEETELVTTESNQAVRIFGSGELILGPGWWDCVAVVDGHYTGPYFDGGNPPPGLTSKWEGSPNASTSLAGIAGTMTLQLTGETLLIRALTESSVASVTGDVSLSKKDGWYRAFGTGLITLGPGYWDQIMRAVGEYEGPWLSDSQTFYKVESWDPQAAWGSAENRRWKAGVDRGMIYRDGEGYPWSGLISVDRTGGQSTVSKRYIDGQLFGVTARPSDFEAKIEAFTYPEEFEECIGLARDPEASALVVHGQESEPFDLAYRILEGDGNGMGENYRICLAYNCEAIDAGTSDVTINDSPELGRFAFDVFAIPQDLPGFRPSAFYEVCSRDVDKGVLSQLERILYGHGGVQPYLPPIEDIRTFLAYGS